MAESIEAALKGQVVLWGAPTFDQAGIAWGEMQHAAGGAAQFNRSRMEVVMPTGGKVILRSLDNPDNARGHTANLVVVDEAPLIDARAWYDVLRPVLSDTNGKALLGGTPKGHNWFWRECQAAKDAPDSAFWQAPTLGVAIVDGKLVRKPHQMENPSFPFAEAERMFESLPAKTFEQEFLAAFVDDAGLVFRGVRGVSTLQPGTPEKGHSYIMGVDWARSYDWTVLSVIDATTKRQVAIDRFNKIDYAFQLGRLEAMAARWHCGSIIAEANSMGTPLIEALQRKGLPVTAFTTTQQSKAIIIEGLALAIEKASIALLADDTQMAELEAYDMERLPGGAFRYNAPQGMHDDTVIATALAWHGAQVPERRKATQHQG